MVEDELVNERDHLYRVGIFERAFKPKKLLTSFFDFKNLYVINFSLRITFKKDPNSSLGFEASIQILFTVLERRIWFIFCTFDKLLKNIDV